MDHVEAVKTGAVERYLLGQLSDSESEDFERHFFGCTHCTEELRAGAVFEENARAVFDEDSPGSARAVEPGTETGGGRLSFWSLLWQRPWNVAPALAALALLAVVGYQNLVMIPGLRGELRGALSPQPVASHVLPPIARGDIRVLDVAKDSRFYTIYMDPAWQGSFSEYLCSAQDESGSTRFSVRVPAPPPGKPIEILMSTAAIPSGRYTVVVRGAGPGRPEADLARYALILKLH